MRIPSLSGANGGDQIPQTIAAEDPLHSKAAQTTLQSSPKLQATNDNQRTSANQKAAEDITAAATEHTTPIVATKPIVATQIIDATETLQPVSVVAANPMIESGKSTSLQSSPMAATSPMVEGRRETPMTDGELEIPTISQTLKLNFVDVQSTPKMRGISSQSDSISNSQSHPGSNAKLTQSVPSSSDGHQGSPIVDAAVDYH
ncbi:OLC1v1024106C1 [Oldenlandia corymbosa var. corymbosa]|uniref:OLC1v1024106C1 n=1 Tax=Oldenlandia corymbosa var. corymbosa TaxID=529605 RepID=A0AAV1C1G5_OLDCO|nr:OLC1v1024106C1 [Oldenlandia corymbosa var. corymbosa]